jgi:hypothetical protein
MKFEKLITEAGILMPISQVTDKMEKMKNCMMKFFILRELYLQLNSQQEEDFPLKPLHESLIKSFPKIGKKIKI